MKNVDRNFDIATTLPVDDVEFYDVRNSPVDIYGFYKPHEYEYFSRLDLDVAKSIREDIYNLARHTSGGRVRFCTDSDYIAIKAEIPGFNHMPHMPLHGSAGFDLYLDSDSSSRFYGMFFVPIDMKDGYEQLIRLDGKEKRYFTIDFPLYSYVKNLYIGIRKGSEIGGGKKYAIEKPVLFYGSSITQGACASRPGTAYTSIISRMLNCDFINLGFSGNARGEDGMADYISGLDVTAFVMDYDHNAPDAEHLRNTHEKMFLKFRKTHPEVPVVIVSRPDYSFHEKIYDECFAIIKNTYDNAVAAGDKAVYLIPGKKLYAGFDPADCSCDNLHPSDAGMLRMAEKIGGVLKTALENAGIISK